MMEEGPLLKSENERAGSIWNYLEAAIFAPLSFGLIVWATTAIWARPCRLAASLECPALLLDLEPVLLALAIWAVGLLVLIVNGRRVPAVLFLSCAAVLAVGKTSAMGSDFGGRAFYVLLAWLSPLTFHFSYALLNRPPRRLGKIILGGLYGTALIAASFLLSLPAMSLDLTGGFALLRLGIRFVLVLSFAAGWGLLFRDYRNSSAVIQQRIRLTVFGTLFGASPLLLLSLIPETLRAPAFVPYEWTFPWLLLSPVSYLYSLSRSRWRRTEAAFNRAAVYYLVIIAFLGIYLVTATILGVLFERPLSHWPLGNALLGVVLLLVFAPMQRMVERLMAWILYGRQIHYAEVIGELAEQLALALDRDALRHLLLQEWPRVMRLSQVIAFLQNPAGDLALLGAYGVPEDRLEDRPVPLSGTLGNYLQRTAAPILDAAIRRDLRGAVLYGEEAVLLDLPGIAYWLPLVSGGDIQGLLLLGRRSDDSSFSTEEEHILATVAHQAAIAAHNVGLMEEIRVARQELARAHQQLLLEQDTSQRRLALELHDQGIQQLTGILFQLSRVQRGLGSPLTNGKGSPSDNILGILQNIQSEIRSLIAYLRSLTYDLHPPGLEEMGLSLALESYTNQLKRHDAIAGALLQLDIERIGPGDLPLPLATSLFRAAQEGLRNALNHAQADRIALVIRRSAGGVQLTLRDNGRGFRVPARLSELASRGHFGLVGMSERMAWAGGHMEIHSEPGAGTEITLNVPLHAWEAGGIEQDVTIR